jgi:hypothetical protein
MLALQFILVEDIASEIERIAAGDVGDAEFAEPGRYGVNRQPRSAPSTNRIGLSDLARQMNEGSIDLMLNQRRAGGAGALGRPPLVDDDDFEARLRKLSATIAPVMPAPMTSTSVSMLRISRRCRTRGAGSDSHSEWPVRRSFDLVTKRI